MTLEVSALMTAIGGMQKQEARVNKAAVDINSAFTAAQNAAAADSVSVSDKAAVVPAVEDAVRGAVLPGEGDVTTALVDMLQAVSAYKANAATVRVTADVEQDLMNIVGKRGS